MTLVSFDGDESHVFFPDDKVTVKSLKALELHNTAIDRMRPDTVSRNVELTKPVITNLFRYLETGTNLESTPERVRNMEKMFA